MAYVGFQKLQGKIQGEGYSADRAGAIAAAIGRRKYGKKRFQAAAAKGQSLKNVAARRVAGQ